MRRPGAPPRPARRRPFGSRHGMNPEHFAPNRVTGRATPHFRVVPGRPIPAKAAAGATGGGTRVAGMTGTRCTGTVRIPGPLAAQCQVRPRAGPEVGHPAPGAEHVGGTKRGPPDAGLALDYVPARQSVHHSTTRIDAIRVDPRRSALAQTAGRAGRRQRRSRRPRRSAMGQGWLHDRESVCAGQVPGAVGVGPEQRGRGCRWALVVAVVDVSSFTTTLTVAGGSADRRAAWCRR